MMTRGGHLHGLYIRSLASKIDGHYLHAGDACHFALYTVALAVVPSQIGPLWSAESLSWAASRGWRE